jgi:hypothetical protein
VAARTSGALATGYSGSLGFASLTRLRRTRRGADASSALLAICRVTTFSRERLRRASKASAVREPVAARTSGALATGYIDSLGFALLTRLRRTNRGVDVFPESLGHTEAQCILPSSLAQARARPTSRGIASDTAGESSSLSSNDCPLTEIS